MRSPELKDSSTQLGVSTDKLLWEKAIEWVLKECKKVKQPSFIPQAKTKRKGYWTRKEHDLFLYGVDVNGWGNWNG